MRQRNLNSKLLRYQFRLEIPESEWYVPAIHLYFNDDLTVAWIYQIYYLSRNQMYSMSARFN